MAFLNDVKFASLTSGTADFGVGAAADGFQLPADAHGVVDGQTHSYTARVKKQFESGNATIDLTNNLLVRTTVEDTSNGYGVKVSFDHPPTVFLTLLARDIALFGTGSTGSTTDTSWYWVGF